MSTTLVIALGFSISDKPRIRKSMAHVHDFRRGIKLLTRRSLEGSTREHFVDCDQLKTTLDGMEYRIGSAAGQPMATSGLTKFCFVIGDLLSWFAAWTTPKFSKLLTSGSSYVTFSHTAFKILFSADGPVIPDSILL